MLKRIHSLPSLPLLTTLFVFGIAVALSVTAIAAWAEPFQGRLWPMSPYAASPLFDMLAFCFLVTYVLTLCLQPWLGAHGRQLVRILACITLVMLLLHPGLLFWQLWRDGFGLPPMSYLHFYTEDQLVGVVFGAAGYLLTALALVYGLRRTAVASRAVTVLLCIGAAGMFWYSLLNNVFVQESWFAGLWIVLGSCSLLGMIWLLLRREA